MRSIVLKILVPLGLILAGVGLILAGPRSLAVQVDEQPAVTFYVFGISVADGLRSAGIPFTTADRVYPGLNKLLMNTAVVSLQHARPVSILGRGEAFLASGELPANWLMFAGVRLFPGDRVLWNGLPIDPASSIQTAAMYALQYQPAQLVDLLSEGATLHIASAASTLGGALLENGFRLRRSDRLTADFAQLLDGPVSVAIQDARLVHVHVDGTTRRGLTAAATVGQALADLGISLQGLDVSIPAEDFPIPEDGEIRVVRIREEIVLQETLVPYESDFQPDPNLELDQRGVINPGVEGLQVTRQRVRYEDDQEVARINEAEWTARQPQKEVLGYGTKVVVKTITTADGTFEYWRAVNVYATSYSPCRLGTGSCNTRTASGAELVKGIVAVRLSWYRYMKGAGVYIPGYGTGIVADVGGGISGKYWIDLGFTDADFQAWHQNTTIYFLTPVPANILYILPY